MIIIETLVLMGAIILVSAAVRTYYVIENKPVKETLSEGIVMIIQFIIGCTLIVTAVDMIVVTAIQNFS